MATLNSPGVSVTVIDESFYTPAAAGTTPLVIVVSAQDKTNPSGTIAAGSEAANAGKVYLITSQRDLTDTFGTPLFYTDSSGNPQHGNELNEYGLQAAYSSLGISSRSYVVRADLDLAQLAPESSVPTGDAVGGTYWVDIAQSVFGIKEWSNSSLKFTVKTPIVLGDDAFEDGRVDSQNQPAPTVGSAGDYAIVMASDLITRLYYKNVNNSWIQVQNTFDGAKALKISPHYDYPTYDVSTQTGSLWVTSTTPSNGANWKIKYYDSTAKEWLTVSAPLYENSAEATYNFDRTGGGLNISVGSLYVDYTVGRDSPEVFGEFQVRRRMKKGALNVVSDAATTTASIATYSFSLAESSTGSAAFGTAYPVVATVTNTITYLGSLIPTSVLAQTNLKNVTATWNSSTKVLTFGHKLGGEIRITNMSTSTRSLLGITPYDISALTGNPNILPYQSTTTSLLATNWKPLVFEARSSAPTTDPADGTLWYNNVVDEVDILVNSGTTWVSYLNYYPSTDPKGPIIQATEPVDGDRSDGGNLVNKDVWIDTSDLENYGKNIYVYDTTVTSGSKWVLQDTTDQSSPDGWIFADARWAANGAATEKGDLTTMRTSNYVDPDTPDPRLYPKGIRLWNTRRSGFNVKKYVKGYINVNDNGGLNIRFNSDPMANYNVDRWVSQYTTDEEGAGIFGRKSQRQVIVKAMKSMVDTSVALRDTDSLNFNLIVAPGYPELISNMVSLNNDRGITAFVIGDTPFRLEPTGTMLTNYGNNVSNALDNGEKGAVTFDEYMAMYYPSGSTTDNSGNNIVVPPSHMILRTFINNDAKSYQWFAPAGTRRGTVDNATSVGYITDEGEFKTQSVPQNLRDVLDDVKINPISNLTGIGLVAYGQRTRAKNASALDRVNVARLVAYLRRQLEVLSRPFLFEPNDAQTRREIKAAAESLMLELVGQRALYDFIVVCDETNNTPARIDRNELYVDIAVEPVKAVEFIYIPLRIKNRGDIEAGL